MVGGGGATGTFEAAGADTKVGLGPVGRGGGEGELEMGGGLGGATGPLMAAAGIICGRGAAEGGTGVTETNGLAGTAKKGGGNVRESASVSTNKNDRTLGAMQNELVNRDTYLEEHCPCWASPAREEEGLPF